LLFESSHKIKIFQNSFDLEIDVLTTVDPVMSRENHGWNFMFLRSRAGILEHMSIKFPIALNAERG